MDHHIAVHMQSDGATHHQAHKEHDMSTDVEASHAPTAVRDEHTNHESQHNAVVDKTVEGHDATRQV